MLNLGFNFKNGVYVHCSKQCEEVAITEFGYEIPGEKTRPPCPPDLDLSSKFGGVVDDKIEAPEEVQVTGKRRRKVVNYAQQNDPSPATQPTSYTGIPTDWFDDRQGKRSKETDEQWDPSNSKSEESDDDDDEIEFLGTTVPEKALVPHAAKAPTSNQSFSVKPASTKPAPPPNQPSQSMELHVPCEYNVALPITAQGLLIGLNNYKDGSTRFGGYRPDPTTGRPGPAEVQSCFRGFDQIVAVDGMSCIGKPFNDVVAMLQKPNGTQHKLLRMRPAVN